MSFIKHVFDPKKHKLFHPDNPEKYNGELPIICRSGGEMTFCKGLDASSNVLKWASEPLEIPYVDPISKKVRKYNPDFFAMMKTTEGPKGYLIEIKPKKQAKPPRKTKKKTAKQLLDEQVLYLKNQAKGIAAENGCKKAGMAFTVITEDELLKRK